MYGDKGLAVSNSALSEVPSTTTEADVVVLPSSAPLALTRLPLGGFGAGDVGGLRSS